VLEYTTKLTKYSPDNTLRADQYERIRTRIIRRFQDHGAIVNRPVTVPVLLHRTGCKHDPQSREGFDPKTLEQIRISDDWPAPDGSSSSEETLVEEEGDAANQEHEGNDVVVVENRAEGFGKKAPQLPSPAIVSNV
jgi:hypothetical protein